MKTQTKRKQSSKKRKLVTAGQHNVRLGILSAVLCLFIGPVLPLWCQSDWPMFGHDESSTRYSPLNQINTPTVQNLVRVWTYHMKKEGPRPPWAGSASSGGGSPTPQAPPIVLRSRLYLPPPYVTAL